MSESFILHTVDSEQSESLFTWGWNEHGNLGHGDKLDRHKPERIENLSNVTIKAVYPGGAYFFVVSKFN